MADVLDLIANLQGFEIATIADESLAQTAGEALSLLRQQLYDGKTYTGARITPSYLDDPFFKSKEAAQRYSDWKDKITPNPNRPKGTPNLFIIGTFHNSITARAQAGGLLYTASFRESPILQKFTTDIYGLGGDYRSQYFSVLLPVWESLIFTATGLKFG